MDNFTITSDSSNAEDYSLNTECCEVSPHHRGMLEVTDFWNFPPRMFRNLAHCVSGTESVRSIRLNS
jgi:hypothetical protein